MFCINLPIGATSFLMIRRFVVDPSYIQAARRGIDYWGIGLLTVGIGALQIVLDKGQEDDWFASTLITTLSIVSVLALVLLVVHLLIAEDPVIDIRIFKERSYAVGVLMMTALGFVLYGTLVLLPVMLQTRLGYPALQAGIAMAPRGLGSFLIMPFVGVLTGMVDVRKLLATGFLLGARRSSGSAS